MPQPILTVRTTKPEGEIASLLRTRSVVVEPWLDPECVSERYVLSSRLAVDRWTGNAFAQGVVDKTLFVSAMQLNDGYARPLMVIEGETDYTYRSLNPQAVLGAISSMIVLYNVSILTTGDPEATASLLTMVARQEQGGIPDISLTPKRKAADLPDMQRRLVEMLPGSGLVVARALLHTFGSVRAIADASVEDLVQAPGLGRKTASRIHRVINADYESVDTERQLEDAIAADPTLLFDHQVMLLDRQHYVFSDRGERQFVDLVYEDPCENSIVLVELKRGLLAQPHYEQLRGYLDNARKSRLCRERLENGASLRGVLASIEPSPYETEDPQVTVSTVDRSKAIRVLKRLRAQSGRSG